MMSNKYTALILKYIFILNLIWDVNVDFFSYKLGQTYKSLTYPKPRIAFFLGQRGYIAYKYCNRH